MTRIRRPFDFFREAREPQLAASGISSPDICAILAQEWSQLPEQEQNRYVHLAIRANQAPGTAPDPQPHPAPTPPNPPATLAAPPAPQDPPVSSTSDGHAASDAPASAANRSSFFTQSPPFSRPVGSRPPGRISLSRTTDTPPGPPAGRMGDFSGHSFPSFGRIGSRTASLARAFGAGPAVTERAARGGPKGPPTDADVSPAIPRFSAAPTLRTGGLGARGLAKAAGDVQAKGRGDHGSQTDASSFAPDRASRSEFKVKVRLPSDDSDSDSEDDRRHRRRGRRRTTTRNRPDAADEFREALIGPLSNCLQGHASPREIDRIIAELWSGRSCRPPACPGGFVMMLPWMRFPWQ
jgi:hypothetical protein